MTGPARIRWLIVGAATMVAATAAVPVAADPPAPPPTKAPKKLPKLQVTIDKAKIDLDNHKLEVRMNREASHVLIKVFDAEGSLLADERHDFAGEKAGAPLEVSWSPNGSEPVGKIDVWGHDAHGYYAGVRIVPWSLSIPHEEVNFATDSAKIRKSEAPKLEASAKLIKEAFSKYKHLGRVTLFIAGHTDTVGKPGHNKQLSNRRARAIASWFRKHGLKLPIMYFGFGESSLLKKTADEVDEPANRRVDYVLAVEPPRMKTSGKPPAWKRSSSGTLAVRGGGNFRRYRNRRDEAPADRGAALRGPIPHVTCGGWLVWRGWCPWRSRLRAAPAARREKTPPADRAAPEDRRPGPGEAAGRSVRSIRAAAERAAPRLAQRTCIAARPYLSTC